MKSVLVLFIALIVLQSSQVNSLKSFKDHKVVSFRIDNEQQLSKLQILELESGFTFWDPPVQSNMKVELVIQPEMFAMFEEIAQQNDIKFEIATDNLQSWLDTEKPLKQRKEGFSLDQYNQIDDVYQFLDEMAESYPNTASVFTVGESYEGRLIKGMKISTNEKNPAIFIEANIHAREWISSATAVWIINHVLTETDPEFKALIDSVNWYIVPFTNPDGYQYSHDENRLWRKTRSIHNIFCRGADPNRNFGYNFRMGGSSKVACTDTYSGPEAFSEPETKALMDFYSTIASEVEAYISFHCAAEVILYPMGHSSDPELLHNADDLDEIAATAVEALAFRYGTVYGYGNVVTKLYVASGSSPDHAYGIFNTPLAYTIEFRAGPGTPSRFILPPEQIQPNSEEVFDALLALITKSKELGYFQMRV